MLKIAATVIVALFLPLSFASEASATRPMVDFHYKDVCKNIKGKQPIYTVVGNGPYSFNLSTARKHDCIVTVSK